MRLSIKHVTLRCVIITKNPNKNQKPPPPHKTTGKTLYRRSEPLKHRQDSFIHSRNDGLQIDNEFHEIIRSIGVENSISWMVSALHRRNGGRRKDYGLRGK